MPFRFSSRSRGNLATVAPELQAVAHLAIKITEVDFVVTEGKRSPRRQAQLVAQGASRTQNSKHLTGRAIDVAALIDGEISWEFRHYRRIAAAFKRASKELGIGVRWGGDWKNLKDGPHFELTN
jgi:peptidoglycan L-alanyl-D-glutamate endopeptidase CwlK